MLHLNSIHLTQFKNYSSASFDFKERVTGICGLNGKGKTNLLDAIYYLCFTKSYFSNTDQLNAQFNTDGFRLEGKLTQVNGEIKEDFSVVSIFRGIGKKEVLVNGVAYEKFSAHIGRFPCVMIAPDDIEMITGGSEQRRRFMDTVLSEMDADYLQQLIIYNKVLQQRNSLLKSFAEQKTRDIPLLQVLDNQLTAPGRSIHEKRKIFSEKLIALARNFYLQIADPAADSAEAIDISYESQLNETPFETLLEKGRERDLASLRSNAGIHKDDLASFLNGKPFKAVGSQGQKKSLLFALKLAEFSVLKENKGFAPLLLLDDVFEKLDDIRMHNLLKWVCVDNESQVFITDTHRERLQETLDNFGFKAQIIEL
jgi:DNA replication and repair protein RecF